MVRPPRRTTASKCGRACATAAVHVEASFIEEIDGEDYPTFYVEIDDFAVAEANFRETDHQNVEAFQSLVEDAIVGGLGAFHSDRTEALFHVVADPE